MQTVANIQHIIGQNIALVHAVNVTYCFGLYCISIIKPILLDLTFKEIVWLYSCWVMLAYLSMLPTAVVLHGESSTVKYFLCSRTHFLHVNTYTTVDLTGSQVKSNQYVMVIVTSICVHITYYVIR